MGLFEARMNGEWASEDQWIIFDGLLSVASIEEWHWRQGKMGFRRPMDYLQWAFVGSKHRRNGVGSKGKRASEDQWIIFDGLLSVESIEEWRWRQGKTGFRRPMDYLRWAIVGGKYRRMAMESIENGLLCLAAFAEIIQSLFEQPHAEELEDAEVDAAH